MKMIECYYADLTAIDINGVPVPTIVMDEPTPAQRAESPPIPAPLSQQTPPQSPAPQQPAPTQRAEDKSASQPNVPSPPAQNDTTRKTTGNASAPAQKSAPGSEKKSVTESEKSIPVPINEKVQAWEVVEVGDEVSLRYPVSAVQCTNVREALAVSWPDSRRFGRLCEWARARLRQSGRRGPRARTPCATVTPASCRRGACAIAS
jgi:hypothetical protein